MLRYFLQAIFLLFASIGLQAQVLGDYRTIASGNWNALAIWQNYNGTTWVAAGVTPTAANANVITIQAGHTVTQNIPTLSIDQVVVNGTMQTLTTAALGSFTVANGAGVDLQINGTFWDLFTTGVITWTGTWQFGPTGTLLKTSASASNTWQASYNGGIATIPATSNWIIRKVAAANPVLTTIGGFYGNLTIENNVAGIWNTAAGSTFQGAGGFPTIKGNLDLGGTGTSTVNFLNQHTNASPTLVQGNVTIRAGNIFANNGTGLEVRGNLTVAGSITYGTTNGRRLDFSGGNAQSVSGAGTLNVYNCTLNKSANAVTLLRPMTVDNVMTFTSGIIFTTATNLLTINTNGTVASANNTSFVNGPCRYVGNAAFTFPVGKNSDYQALAYSASPGGGTFWTEAFQNGCASNCNANGYVGPNGAWTITTAVAPDEGCGPADYPNIWYVSGAECGNAAGACGTGCGGTDPSLHIGSTSIGDLGAAYDAGGYCPLLSSPGTQTDIRSESPTINCTGQSNILLSFNYIENGNGTLDNATLWYYDGAVWAQLIDLPKTLFGSCSPQGWWTAYSITLPVSANNNPNIKIGFRWVNNDDGIGSDPSFAVDDITLSVPGPVCDFTCEYFYANPQIVYNNVLAPTLSSISACEYWTLTRNAGTANKTITLTWDANSCPLIPLITDTRVAHFDLTTWQDEGNGANTGNTTAGTVSSAAPVTYFSPFTIGLIPPAPLPIELTDFSGNCLTENIQLEWTTASEENNNYFTIERSQNGSSFLAIAEIDGAGNSSQPLHYSFIDHQPVRGINYYRLKQTDFNGQFSYSKIISINSCGQNQLSLDNAILTESGFEISYSSAAGPVSIEVFSADGKLLARSENLNTAGIYPVPMANLPSGIYFIRVSDGFSSLSRSLAR